MWITTNWKILKKVGIPDHLTCLLRNFSALHGTIATATKSLQLSLTLRPHRRQPTRLPCPWDSLGKNTAVGCHFLLQCMKVKSESEVAQSCPTLSDPMDCSLPGSSVHGFSRQEFWSGVPLPTPKNMLQGCNVQCRKYSPYFITMLYGV